MIKRLRLLINYINDPDLDDPDYEVSYLLDNPVNLRTAFSQANAFDILPIIPEYEGMIGESIDKDRGSLLIVPLSEKLVKETNYIDLEKILDQKRNEDFIKQLKLLVKSGKYPKQIISAAYSLIDLTRTLFSELERSQKLTQTSLSSERYYALPIRTYPTNKTL